MTERPILFNGAMVRAILDGRKTQTRRVAKPQPAGDIIRLNTTLNGKPHRISFFEFDGPPFHCPYGQPGDRLWVREAFVPRYFDSGRPGYRADYDKARVSDLVPEPKWTPSIHMPRAACRIVLEVTGVRVERLQAITEADAIAEGVHPAPGLRGDDDLMVCEIMSAYPLRNEPCSLMQAPIARFVLLWDSINNVYPRNWNANPWVWVVEFKRVAP